MGTDPDRAARSAGARPVLEIDLGAIADNWRRLRDQHRIGHPQARTGAVVKADGYGLGAERVAAALHAAGCRHFFVARWQEALALRPLLPGAMLAVLDGPAPGDAADYLAQGIAPVLNTLAQVHEWAAHANRAGLRPPVLLQLDTGMNRLGLDQTEQAMLQADPAPLAKLDVLFVMTHLASPEQPGNPGNAAQRRCFLDACAGLPAMPRSLAASSGIFLGPEFASDLARPGAGLFGINPAPGLPNPLRPVVRLRAPVIQLRDIGPGEAVGYNGTWRAARPSRIATLAVGYADGWPRALSNRGAAFFDGAAAPLVGRVSMDLTTFDATDLPALRAGDWLELIGPHQTPDMLAALANTNGYEILTNLGRRYERRYTGTAA